MAIQLQTQTDPYNLQGNTRPLQGAAVPLQGSGMPVAAAPAPVVQQTAPRPAIAAPAAAPAVSTPQTFKFASGQQVSYDPITGQQAVLQPKVPAPAPVVDPNQRLATNAGLSGASTDDYLKMLGSQTAITPEERASIYQQLGIPDLAASARSEE